MSETSLILQRALTAFQKGNYDYARDILAGLVEKEPNNHDARRLLYTSCLKRLELQGKQTIRIKLMQTKVAAELQFKKDFAERIKVLQKHLLDDPLNFKMRTLLGDTLRQAGFLDGAIAELRIVVERDDNNIDALKAYALALQQKGLGKEAQGVLEKAARIATEDREITKMLKDTAAINTMQKGFEGAKDFTEVIKDKKEARTLDQQTRFIKSEDVLQDELKKLEAEYNTSPSDNSAKKLGDYYMEQRKDFAQAGTWYKKALEHNQQDTMLKDKYEDCVIKLQDLKIIKARKENDPKVQEYEKEKLITEIKVYERRVKDRPTDSVVRFELGKRYLVSGGTYVDKAVAEFQQSVKDPKKRMESHFYLASCFKKKKMFDIADNQLQKAEEANTGGEEKLLAIWYERAQVNAEAGRHQKAVEIGKKILEVDINYKDILTLITKWEEQGKPRTLP